MVTSLPKVYTGIAYTGASHLYIAPHAPHGPINTKARKIHVGTANGQVVPSSATATLPMPQQGHNIPCEGHIMPTFTNTLVGIGPICDAGCTVTFASKDETVYLVRGLPIITGWRGKHMPKMWRFALSPTEDPTTPAKTINKRTSIRAYSAYDLPSVAALVIYLHAAAGIPTKHTWLSAIKVGNFDMWLGLTYSNASKYFPQATETIKGHMTQTNQGVRSTKAKPFMVEARAHSLQQTSSTTNEVHLYKKTIIKLYTDDCGRFPIK